MSNIFSELTSQILNPSNLFIISGLLLVFAELFVGIEAGFDLILIGSILIISGFTGVLTANIWIAIVMAIILSIIYLTYARKFIKHKIMFQATTTNIDKLVGQQTIALTDITPQKPGSIKIDDETWRASSTLHIKSGAKVQIDSIDGVTLKVSQINNSSK